MTVQEFLAQFYQKHWLTKAINKATSLGIDILSEATQTAKLLLGNFMPKINKNIKDNPNDFQEPRSDYSHDERGSENDASDSSPEQIQRTNRDREILELRRSRTQYHDSVSPEIQRLVDESRNTCERLRDEAEQHRINAEQHQANIEYLDAVLDELGSDLSNDSNTDDFLAALQSESTTDGYVLPDRRTIDVSCERLG